MVQPRIVVGLGNPGSNYAGTRHNLGFDVVESLAGSTGWKNLGWWSRLCWFASIESNLILAKPRTFMNRAGDAVQALCRRFDAGPESLLVVYDDADLGLGRMRLRKKGGSGGHNGLRSIESALGSTDFSRLRLGVRGERRTEQPLADYVLGRFDDEELPAVAELVRMAADCIRTMQHDGFEFAMNRYNARSAAPFKAGRSAEEEG